MKGRIEEELKKGDGLLGKQELCFELLSTSPDTMELGASSTAYKRSGGRDYEHLLPEVWMLLCLTVSLQHLK